MEKMRKLLALLMALAMLFSFAACGGGGDGADETSLSNSNENNTSDEGNNGTPQNTEVTLGWLGTNYIVNPYDPLCGWGMAYSQATQSYLIYDQIFYTTNDGGFYSRILEDWEWTDDTTLMLYLKDNVYFSNGDQLLGDDILFSYQAMLDGFFPIKFMYAFADLENSTVSDDGLTVTLKMHDVTPSAIAFMTGLSVLNKDYVESVGGENIDWYDPSQVVGSGPYKPVEYVQDSYSVYELRDDYWGAEEYEFNIEKITVRLYSDATTMMADYSNGLLDLAWGVTNDDYVAAENGDYGNSAVGRVSNNFVSWLCMEVDQGACADPAVREAICYAIDVDALREVVLGNLGTTSAGAFATSMLGYTDDFQYSYDPDYARQVLADAGYADGDITITYSYKSDDPVQSDTAEMIQGYLLAIGINCELNPLDEATYSAEETVEGYSDIAYYFMSNGAQDPGQFTGNWTSTGSNAVMSRGTLYDDIIAKANGTLDEDERIEAYYELQREWYENFDLVPLFELNTAYIYNTDVFAECIIHNINANMTLNVSVK